MSTCGFTRKSRASSDVSFCFASDTVRPATATSPSRGREMLPVVCTVVVRDRSSLPKTITSSTSQAREPVDDLIAPPHVQAVRDSGIGVDVITPAGGEGQRPRKGRGHGDVGRGGHVERVLLEGGQLGGAVRREDDVRGAAEVPLQVRAEGEAAEAPPFGRGQG